MFNKYPYTNFHELNLEYFIKHFEEIFDQWNELYTELQNWKTSTTEELEAWKTAVENDMSDWETATLADLEAWKTETGEDIDDWEASVLIALNSWKSDFETLFATTFANLTQIKTDAETARNAAQAAQAAAEDAQDAAEDAANSVSASAAQITTNTSNITLLQEENKAKFTSLTETGYITPSGGDNNNADYKRTPFISFTSNDKFYLFDFYNVTALAYAFYSAPIVTAFISGSGNISGNLSSDDVTIPSNTKYVRFSTKTASNPNAQVLVGNTLAVEAELRALRAATDTLNTDITTNESAIETLYSTFTAIYSETGNINVNGELVSGNTDYKSTVFIPIDENTKIALHGVYTGSSSLACAFYSNNNEQSFISGMSSIQSDSVVNTIPANAKYVRLCSRISQGENPRGVVYNFGQTLQRIKGIEKRLNSNEINPLIGTDVLIFGDSITVTCNLTINSDDEVTAVQWRNTSYVNEHGQTITYDKWANMIYNMNICREIRNYAYSGASYKDKTRQTGDELQDVSYQITVAINDLTNPNGAYAVNDFSPNIVIFALGTNDGTISDTYADAMAKTIFKADGHTIDIDATLNALDRSKFCEAVRWAYLKCRQFFPTAQFYCVTPIQSVDHAGQLTNTLYNNLEAMAKRYGAFIIDGKSEIGIIEDNNTYSSYGDTLKDGLHPNEKGQNMMFKTIYGYIKSHYGISNTINP